MMEEMLMSSKIPKKGIDRAKNGAVIIPVKHGKKMVVLQRRQNHQVSIIVSLE